MTDHREMEEEKGRTKSSIGAPFFQVPSASFFTPPQNARIFVPF